MAGKRQEVTKLLNNANGRLEPIATDAARQTDVCYDVSRQTN